MNKSSRREYFLKLIQSLSLEEKKQASTQACSYLINKLLNSSTVASYSSLQTEINLHYFNQELAKKGRLLLPKVEGKQIIYYRVQNIETELVKSKQGVLEPFSSESKKVSLEDVSLFLVPGIAFDKDNYRLGRGGGFYDRLLAYPLKTLSVAYRIQKSSQKLPREPHDRPVDEVLYF